ncbi:MAG: phosphoribosyltransferase family protein [Pseudomonadota bacterium]
MMFTDRDDAARRLAARLAHYRGQNPLILAIPRGAVPMGAVLADELEGELDVILSHKLRAPQQPELAIGAIGEDGRMYLNPRAVSVFLNISEAYLERERDYQLALLRERRRALGLPPADPAGRIVIVVDDGVATGATMKLALLSLGERAPRRLICAVPVGPPETISELEDLAGEVVCLHVAPDFMSVGQYYHRFTQVSDAEVTATLQRRT